MVGGALESSTSEDEAGSLSTLASGELAALGCVICGRTVESSALTESWVTPVWLSGERTDGVGFNPEGGDNPKDSVSAFSFASGLSGDLSGG